MYYLNPGLPLAERTKQREEEILQIIKEYWLKHNYSPTVREIAKKASIRSTSTVFKYLIRLKEKGIIEWEPKMPRTIHVVVQTKKVSTI